MKSWFVCSGTTDADEVAVAFDAEGDEDGDADIVDGSGGGLCVEASVAGEEAAETAGALEPE